MIPFPADCPCIVKDKKTPVGSERKATYALLELVQIGGGHGIGLGNDGNQVDAGAQALHNLNIQGFEGVSSWANKVETAVHTHVAQLEALGLLLLTHIRLVLVINKVDNGHPAVAIVGIISKSRSVNHRQLDIELLLLEFFGL